MGVSVFSTQQLTPSHPPQFAFDILSCHRRWLKLSICHIITEPLKRFFDALASLEFKLSVSQSVTYRFQLAHLRVSQIIFFGCLVSLLPRKLRCRSPQFAILGCPSQFRKVRDMAERQDQDWYPENKKLLIKISIREITNFSTLLMHLSHASIQSGGR